MSYLNASDSTHVSSKFQVVESIIQQIAKSKQREHALSAQGKCCKEQTPTPGLFTRSFPRAPAIKRALAVHFPHKSMHKSPLMKHLQKGASSCLCGISLVTARCAVHRPGATRGPAGYDSVTGHRTPDRRHPVPPPGPARLPDW